MPKLQHVPVMRFHPPEYRIVGGEPARVGLTETLDQLGQLSTVLIPSRRRRREPSGGLFAWPFGQGKTWMMSRLIRAVAIKPFPWLVSMSPRAIRSASPRCGKSLEISISPQRRSFLGVRRLSRETRPASPRLAHTRR